jgi:hypothetical protein
MIGNEIIKYTCHKNQYCVKRFRRSIVSEISAVSVSDENFYDNKVNQFDMISLKIMCSTCKSSALEKREPLFKIIDHMKLDLVLKFVTFLKCLKINNPGKKIFNSDEARSQRNN